MTKARDLSQTPNASLGFKNRIINGAMSVWQRGTSFAGIATSAYTVDRWQSTIAGSSLNVTASQSTSVPSNAFEYSLQYQQVSSSATSVTEYATRQRFELNNVRDLAGNSVTVSFWYRSNITGTHGVRILPLGTTGGVDTSIAITVNTANTWEYKTVTTTALSAITSWGATAGNAAALILDIGFRVNGVGQATIAANDYFQVTGVQLEKGSTATSFDYRAYGTELQLAKRYYRKLGGETAADVLIQGYATAGQGISCTILLDAGMRTAPTVTRQGTWVDMTAGTFASYPSTTSVGIQFSPSSSTSSGTYTNGGSLTLAAEL